MLLTVPGAGAGSVGKREGPDACRKLFLLSLSPVEAWLGDAEWMPHFPCRSAESAGHARQVRPPAPLSQKDVTIPVVIMIGREITMSALREWAAASGSAAHRAVKVNTLGKYKTALQVRACTSLCRRPQTNRDALETQTLHLDVDLCNGLA